MLGAIEGFYGRPWSALARLQTIAFLGQANFNTYIYAPKSDRQLRRGWREAAPWPQFDELIALREQCRLQGVRFGVGFSPWGLQSEYAQADQKALRVKLQQLNALDCDVVCVLFDDMPGAIADLALRQAQIVADIQAFSTARRMLMCPTYYSFDPQLAKLFGPMPERYLETLGAALAPAVDILWTGNLVVPPGFSKDDIEQVSARLGRKPCLWDNYPVNDGRKISRFLHLLPPPARPWQLQAWCSGHLVNPMNQALLSQLPLAALGASYAGRDDFNATEFWRDESQRYVGAPLAALLQRDVERFQYAGLDQIDAVERAALIEEYRLVAHPAAQEVCDWLNELYRFDPECLND